MIFFKQTLLTPVSLICPIISDYAIIICIYKHSSLKAATSCLVFFLTDKTKVNLAFSNSS